MKAVSLFSGAGGLDWGFRSAGFKIVFATDVDEASAKTYAYNFGMRLCWGCAEEGAVSVADVRKLSFRGLQADIVVGGPPCQDFSVARGPRRSGLVAERGKLYREFARALREIRPVVYVFENVPGMLSDGFATAVRAFERSGYTTAFAGVVDFSALGVPQKRERLLIIGVMNDLRGAAEEVRRGLKEALSGPLAKAPLTAMEVLEGRPLDELQKAYEEVIMAWKGVWDDVGTERALRWKREVWDKLTLDVVRDYEAIHGVRLDSELLRARREVLRRLGYYGVPACAEDPGDGTCSPPADSPQVRERLRRIPPGEGASFLDGTKWAVRHRGISMIYRRLHPLKPAYTVVAYGGGGTYGYHYRRDRATLKLREKARLQTFPDTFLFAGTRAEIRAQIGEAVPPLAAKIIAQIITKIL
ncbi:MAG: DNA cytosine methyltransferase [Thermofilaceae archaeon]|uniref:DNA cytosine methyltransferase n=1 Tax=Pyrobaculum sp. TaxID=2004705 RepID=UPI003161D130